MTGTVCATMTVHDRQYWRYFYLYGSLLLHVKKGSKWVSYLALSFIL